MESVFYPLSYWKPTWRRTGASSRESSTGYREFSKLLRSLIFLACERFGFILIKLACLPRCVWVRAPCRFITSSFHSSWSPPGSYWPLVIRGFSSSQVKALHFLNQSKKMFRRPSPFSTRKSFNFQSTSVCRSQQLVTSPSKFWRIC